MTKRYVQVEGRWDGTKLEKNFKQTSSKITKISEGMAKKTGKFVNEDMSRAMKGFNEKTEKGRQLMTAFGGTLGAAGGQATYYAGTITYVYGAFEKWELAVMGVIGSLVGLGAKLHQLATEDISKAQEEMAKLNKETESFVAATKKTIALELLRRAGLKEHQIQLVDINDQYDKTVDKLYDLRHEYNELQQATMTGGFFEYVMGGKGAPEIEKQIKDTEKLLADLAGLMKTVDRMGEKPKGRKLLQGTGPSVGGGGPGLMGFGILAGLGLGGEAALTPDPAGIMEGGEREYEAWLNAQRGFLDRRRQAETAYIEGMTALIESNADRRERIAQNEIALQEQKAEVMIRGVQTLSEISNVILAETKANTAIQVGAILAEAAIQASMEVARGFGKLGAGMPWAAAMHFTAAALYGAMGISKAVETGSGGGGGASVSARERAQGHEGRQEESREPSVMNVYIGGKYVGRAINDALEGYQDQKNPGRRRTEVR